MSVTRKLEDYLEANAVDFEVIPHPRRVTALETAEVEHVPGSQMAKAVIVKADGRDVMIVIPANRKLDLLKTRYELEADEVRIEEECEFEELFPDCEVGAMPPLGPLYKVPCYVDVTLAEKPAIYFNAGTHEEGLRIAMKDYLRLAEAQIGDFAIPFESKCG